MGQKIILDSNILIYSANGVIELEQSFFSDNIVLTSVITEMEVLGYNLTEIEEINFENLFKKIQIVQIDNTIVKTVIKIRRSTKIGLADAIIAATCIENKAALMTANTKDFSKIPHLKLINPLK